MTEIRFYPEISVAGVEVQVISRQHWQLPDGTDIVCRRSRDTWGRDYEWHVLDDHGAPARICPSLYMAVAWWLVQEGAA